MKDRTVLRSYDLTVLHHENDNLVHHLSDGIVLGSFSGMIKQFGHLYRNFFDQYGFSDDAIADQDTMSGSDGFFLYIPANTKPSQPIRIANLFDGRNETSIRPRNVVIMEAGSSAELLAGDFTLSGNPCSCNDVTEVALGEAATLNMVRMQKVNGATRLITTTTVWQTASSRMKTHYISLGEGNIRNSMKVKLAGKNAGHDVSGLSMTQQTGHIDNDVLIEHASPDCQSNQLFKHILSDASTGVFTGRIVVCKDAQKTSAYQRSSNILLHPKAKMKIRPQLEIYADDVKCSHGATVGQLDAEALFYLRSRGISEVEAKQMLLNAFANEVINGISCESFRENIFREL